MNPGRTSLEAEVSMERAALEVPEDPPFHILVLGDFSGNREKGPFRPVQVDRDDFADVMKRLGPRVSVSAGLESHIDIGFNELDEFHPDRLFKRVSLFDELRDVRGRLSKSETFSSAAREVRGWFSDDAEEPKREAVAPVVVEGGEGLLEDILGSRTRDAAAYKPEKTAALRDFVKQVVDPFLVTVDEDEQARLLAGVDEVTSGIMRKILRDPAFKKLEAAWRGLFLMCRRIETSKDLKIFIIDVSKERFVEELKKEEESELVDILLGGTGNEPWAVVAGVYDFDLNVEDVAGLIRAGAVASVTGSPFVSHVRPSMLGIRSFAESPDYTKWDTKSETAEGKLWTALRGSKDAASIGLIAPRLLGRLPYGEETDSTEVFAFEEFDAMPAHDDYLWMNPVFGFAVALANSFSKLGWNIGGRYELDVNGLPVHVYSGEEGTRTKPCAEIEMTDGALQLMLEEGLMPFASFRNSDRVRLGGIQSVKFPQKALAGRWS